MPKLTQEGDLERNTAGHFGFTAVDINELEESGYTLAVIVCDRSGSTSGFQKPMELALKASIEALKKHPMSASMMVRLLTIDTKCEEQHGFVLVDDIDTSRYDDMLRPQGVTALFDGLVNAAESAANFGEQLIQQRYTANGILIAITDGMNNAGRFSRDADVSFVKDAFQQTTRSEKLESFATILIGVGVNPNTSQYLNEVHGKAGFTVPMIELKNATAENIAKIGDFITDSVSSTSVARGTGGPSQSISF